jgi:cytochrome P450
MQLSPAAASDFDPFCTAFLSDPYPFHEAMREAGPVVRLDRYEIWATARHEQVATVLSDYDAYCSSAGVGLSDFRKEQPWRPPSIILEADPPLHARTHRVLMRALSPAALRDLRPAFEHEAERLVDALLQLGEVDGVADIGRAYPLKVFPDAIGVRPDGRENLLPYGSMVFNAFGPPNELFRQAMARAQEVIGWITAACERDALAPGGLGRTVYAAHDAGEIAYDEARLLIRSLLSAGLDTTVHGIGNALFCFASFPDQWDALRADPSIARTAFDEAMRLEAPVQTFFRTTTREIDLGGTRIGAGEKVLAFLSAANRDPRRWADPDRFDVHRRTGGHVGFGHGIHRCVGEMLSKLEGEILFAALARRVRSIRIAGEPVHRLNNTLRGFESLPLVLEAD